MDSTLKAIRKLIDNLILPQYEDIYEYQVIPDNFIIEIVFWMDGTDQEIEEEIVDECKSVLSMIGSKLHRFKFKFTTEGEHFYEYS
jgi:ferredoxin-fold anticodon binding domain-containing protein